MKIQKMQMTDLEEKEVSMLSYFMEEGDCTNDKQRERMKRLIGLSIQNELTDRQKQCLRMKYFDEMKIKDIAKALDIREVTVYKHISRAIAAIKRVAVYL